MLLELPIDVNAVLEPLITTIQPYLVKLSLLVGGIFGLYLIIIILRVYYDRKTLRLLKDIRYDLDNLNKHFGAMSSDEKKGVFSRVAHYFRGEKHYHVDPGPKSQKKK